MILTIQKQFLRTTKRSSAHHERDPVGQQESRPHKASQIKGQGG